MGNVAVQLFQVGLGSTPRDDSCPPSIEQTRIHTYVRYQGLSHRPWRIRNGNEVDGGSARPRFGPRLLRNLDSVSGDPNTNDAIYFEQSQLYQAEIQVLLAYSQLEIQ